MKKIIFSSISILFITFVFAEGTCKEHGYYPGSYCPTCEYNKGSNAGSKASNSGWSYNDRICREKEVGNYIETRKVPRTNQNAISDCVDGYRDAYGEREWCSKCKRYYPSKTHSHN